ncbi:hypothetical protein ACK8HX_13230 [Oryzobacter sp. R7]|uniref:hypothetical protein n=1 Tax=Oryzobacter faecalis TaxID=3388656 RepID=UPI00398C8779
MPRPDDCKNPAFVLNGKLGAARRYRPDEDHTELEREVKLANLADYVKRVVDEAPPLTGAQRAELARILRGSKPPASRSA